MGGGCFNEVFGGLNLWVFLLFSFVGDSTVFVGQGAGLGPGQG